MSSSSSKRPQFPVDAKVEVRSFEKAFRGGWFEASVAHYNHALNNYRVNYTSIVSEEDPTVPHTDVVSTRNIRRPPPRSRTDTGFELHSVVEAFHNDGWWKGVVSAVPEAEGGKYSVCFPNTREEYEFGKEEIREYLCLVNGKWVNPEAKGGHDVLFTVGTCVEVSRHREYFGAAWYIGTISKVIAKSFFLIEYESLWKDDDKSSGIRQQEIVSLQYIRPSQPKELMNFHAGNEVEVFRYLDGAWHCATVLGTIGEAPEPHYLVKFKYLDQSVPEEQYEQKFYSHEIRPCSIWFDGRWIRGDQKSFDGASLAILGTKSAGRRGRPPKADRSSIPITPASPLGTDGSERDRANSSQRRKRKGKSLELSPMVNAATLDCKSKTMGVVRKLLSVSKSPLHSPEILNEIMNMKRRGSLNDQHDSGTRGSRTPRAIASCTSNASMSKGASCKRNIGSSEPNKRFKSGNSHEQFVGDSSEASKEVAENPINHSDNKASDKADEPDVDCALKLSELQKKVSGKKVVKPVKRSVVKTPKLKRMVSSSSLPASRGQKRQGKTKLHRYHRFKDINTLGDDPAKTVIRDPYQLQQSLDPKLHGKVKKRSKGRIASRKFAKGNAEEPNKVETTENNGKGSCVNELISEVIAELDARELLATSKEDNMNDNTRTSAEDNANGNIELPQSDSPCCVATVEKTVEVDISPVDIQASVHSPLQEANDQNGSESANDAVDTEQMTHFSPVRDVPSFIQPLPFTKQNPMWDIVLSRDVYRKMPQYPHFRPLEQCEMQLREGNALGCMIAFADVVESIEKLCLVDPELVFEEKLRALSSMEPYGFSVQHIRSKIDKLLDVRRTYRQLVEKKADLDKQLQMVKDENHQLDALLREQDQVILDFEERLTSYSNELSSLESERDNIEMEIVQLESDLQETDEDYNSEEHFNSVAKAPW